MSQSLTIAYVGNFQKPWCTEVHVAASLESLGHRVVRLQENTLDWRQLVQLVEDADASLLLWTRTWEVDRDAALQALDDLRARGVRSVSYHLDRWWGLAREYQLTTEPFFRTDLVVTPDGGNDDAWVRVGIEHLWMPPGVFDAECAPGTPNRRLFPHDVVFVGTSPYPHPEWHDYRAQLLDTMHARFGARFAVHPTSKHRPVRGRQLAALYASAKVVIGDSCLAGGARSYWSDRVPETLGRGGLLVHPYDETLAEWYPELPMYELGDFDGAANEVERLLSISDVERIALRERLRSIVLDRDTYRHRLAAVLDHVEHLPVGRASRVADRVTASQQTLRASFQLDSCDSDDGAVSEVWRDDTYELNGVCFSGTVLDVGANVGAFSVLAAKLGAARVHAWEPSARAAELLRLNAKANDVDDRVIVHEAALRACDGFTLLSGIGVNATTTGADGTRVVAEAISVAWSQLDDIEFVKLDCEGAEYELIGALDDELLDRVEQLVMEYHGPAMPGLELLDADGRHERRFGAMLTKLAAHGRVSLIGRPDVGGVLRWVRY